MEHALLDDPEALERRRGLIVRPTALSRYVEDLRRRHGEVPDPDPLDGGLVAPLLLLLETPGPSVGRSGFVSADNPTGTGRNLRRFWAEAGLSREQRLIWNAVPWVIHVPGARNRAPRRAELKAGLRELPGLLDLLRLRVVVLAGRSAAAAAPLMPAGIPVLLMSHPSPTITCTSPSIPARIRATLAEAARILSEP